MTLPIIAPDWSPSNFSIDELVSPEIFHYYGENLCWQFLDIRAVYTLQQLRDKFGRIKVNDWKRGGVFSYSGLRPLDYHSSKRGKNIFGGYYKSPIGSKYSQHKFGRAFDCKFLDLDTELVPGVRTVEDVRQYIINNPDEFPYLTTLEMNTSTWMHFDCRSTKYHNRKIHKVYP